MYPRYLNVRKTNPRRASALGKIIAGVSGNTVAVGTFTYKLYNRYPYHYAMECPITGFEFMVEIGVNGHNEEEAKKNISEMLGDICPYFLTGTAKKQYIEERMNEASKLMGEHTDNGQMYEYYKGRFLAFREILKPDIYGKDAKEVEKELIKDESS